MFRLVVLSTSWAAKTAAPNQGYSLLNKVVGAQISQSRAYTPFNPPPRKAEDTKTKRNRLLYESRKRGNLENGLLLA